ncbi:universal stress protein [Flavobacterium sp.]|uniref:universal stress protein n=1 Tax=Flavobacterium sp. TaxID=239 RepID=UPI003BC98332
MKKILFPTDFSNVATNAFVHALGLAKLVDGELILLHTYELPIMDSQFGIQNYSEVYNTIELTNLDKFRDEIPKLRKIAEENGFEAIKMSHILTDCDLLHSIKETVKKENIDYLVMGTSGASGWFEKLLGTNTGEAIKSLSIPVFCIPVGAKYSKINTIGFTTRFREKDKVALQNVINIAKASNAKVKCLYVESSDSDNNLIVYQEWESYFKNEQVQFFIIPGENVHETIDDFIISQEIDVLTMISYKRSFFNWLFISSLTEEIAFQSTIPILALHD